MKLADACQPNMHLLGNDISLDILENQDSVRVQTERIKTDTQNAQGTSWPSWRQPGLQNEGSQSSRPSQLQIEDDNLIAGVVDSVVTVAVPGQGQSQEQSKDDIVTEHIDELSRTDALFPNSFKITGFKHICDNLLGAVLNALPQCLGFALTGDGM